MNRRTLTWNCPPIVRILSCDPQRANFAIHMPAGILTTLSLWFLQNIFLWLYLNPNSITEIAHFPNKWNVKLHAQQARYSSTAVFATVVKTEPLSMTNERCPQQHGSRYLNKTVSTYLTRDPMSVDSRRELHSRCAPRNIPKTPQHLMNVNLLFTVYIIRAEVHPRPPSWWMVTWLLLHFYLQFQRNVRTINTHTHSDDLCIIMYNYVTT